MQQNTLMNWGRYGHSPASCVRTLLWRQDNLPVTAADEKLLAYGLGRSYGDSCLNGSHTLLLTRQLDRLLAFDRIRGRLRCEAGLSLDAILKIIVPSGWFLPVSPGTKFVTIGGAIANDVHGKNHHRAGTFGHHVVAFELLRSDGQRILCSPESNPEYFFATIGGLGLTGLITWAEVQLQAISSPWIDQKITCFTNLDEFFELTQASAQNFAYTVAWIDCLAKGADLGRGVFFQGNHVDQANLASYGNKLTKAGRAIKFPLDLPGWALNRMSVGLFNWAYYNRQKLRRASAGLVHYEPFFYPLDTILQWNRMYGRKGFLQYQCVLPFSAGNLALREMLRIIAQSGLGSFLSVLKAFGEKPSLGLLSFPRPGVTLALDFAYRGPQVLRLLERLDEVTRAAGGCVYPAKDARMSGETFRQYFPRWQEFKELADPRFSSDFWRRVTQ